MQTISTTTQNRSVNIRSKTDVIKNIDQSKINALKKSAVTTIKDEIFKKIFPFPYQKQKVMLNSVLIALDVVQDGINNHGGYFNTEKYIKNKNYDPGFLKVLLADTDDVSLKTNQLKSNLELICMHQNTVFKDRKFSFFGINYTKSAELLKTHFTNILNSVSKQAERDKNMVNYSSPVPATTRQNPEHNLIVTAPKPEVQITQHISPESITMASTPVASELTETQSTISVVEKALHNLDDLLRNSNSHSKFNQVTCESIRDSLIFIGSAETHLPNPTNYIETRLIRLFYFTMQDMHLQNITFAERWHLIATKIREILVNNMNKASEDFLKNLRLEDYLSPFLNFLLTFKPDSHHLDYKSIYNDNIEILTSNEAYYIFDETFTSNNLLPNMADHTDPIDLLIYNKCRLEFNRASIIKLDKDLNCARGVISNEESMAQQYLKRQFDQQAELIALSSDSLNNRQTIEQKYLVELEKKQQAYKLALNTRNDATRMVKSFSVTYNTTNHNPEALSEVIADNITKATIPQNITTAMKSASITEIKAHLEKELEDTPHGLKTAVINSVKLVLHFIIEGKIINIDEYYPYSSTFIKKILFVKHNDNNCTILENLLIITANRRLLTRKITDSANEIGKFLDEKRIYCLSTEKEKGFSEQDTINSLYIKLWQKRMLEGSQPSPQSESLKFPFNLRLLQRQLQTQVDNIVSYGASSLFTKEYKDTALKNIQIMITRKRSLAKQKNPKSNNDVVGNTLRLALQIMTHQEISQKTLSIYPSYNRVLLENIIFGIDKSSQNLENLIILLADPDYREQLELLLEEENENYNPDINVANSSFASTVPYITRASTPARISSSTTPSSNTSIATVHYSIALNPEPDPTVRKLNFEDQEIAKDDGLEPGVYPGEVETADDLLVR